MQHEKKEISKTESCKFLMRSFWFASCRDKQEKMKNQEKTFTFSKHLMEKIMRLIYLNLLSLCGKCVVFIFHTF